MIQTLLSLALAMCGQDSATERHFETRIRPLLAEHCWKCHGAQTSRGGLRLDSQGTIAKGGKRGPAILPGKPEASLLFQAVRRAGDLKMPPDGPLTEAQIRDLGHWIKSGGVFPKEQSVKSAEGVHWAFQPLKTVVTGPGHPVDALVRKRLVEEGIAPAPAADPVTLFRRATLDLTGLPPSVEGMEKFLADKSADAWPRLVDSLLASSAHGERWGRHWLDVARYADSNGLDENVAHGNAWRYRDYVVNAFNADMPFDQFIREQVAGDLLEAPTSRDRHRMLVATGFLSLGPKVLAEVDKKKLEMDIIDEQIETTGKAFLGMTLGCARCHDHKFDPVTTSDYYALAGILKSTRTMDDLKTVAKWHENTVANAEETRRDAEHKAVVARAQAAVDGFLDGQRKRLLAEGRFPANSKPGAKEIEAGLGEKDKAELKKLRDTLAGLQKTAPDLPSAMGVAEAPPVHVAIHIRGSTERLGATVERGIPKAISGGIPVAIPDKSSGRLELARWLTSERNPLTARVIVNRVWRWHFGTGIVPSVDNFGLLGDKPGNPDLLDWLAGEFVRTGWSLKKLHKLILTSETYRQSTAQSPASALKDPAGKLFSRWVPRRMEAEAIRDSMLAVGGKLDRTMGGSLLTVKNRDYFFDHTSKDLTRYDSPRRSLYLPVVRNNLYEVMQLFDGTDATVSNGNRADTTIPTQALFFLNGPLVQECSKGLAERVAREHPSQPGQMDALYRLALCRTPTPGEIRRGEEWIRMAMSQAGLGRQAAMAAYAQVLISTNEFVTIR